jgi:hypothetical protein
MYQKFYCFLLLLFVVGATQVFACDTAINEGLTQPIDNFYHWANATYGSTHSTTISPSNLHKQLGTLFSPDIIHTLNGKIVTTNISELEKRFSTLAKKYRSVDVILPYQSRLIDSNQKAVAIHYKVVFTLNDNSKKTLQAITLFTIRQHKIASFDEVSSPEEDHL